MEGSVIAGRYVISGVIGSGGMANVYRGADRETGEDVAIKVLRSEYMQDEAYVRRFEKESQIAVKYSHKNIVRTIEVGCQNGMHYIVMEYVSGKTLKEQISRQGRIRPGDAVRIGRQICDALFYAHSHQLVHRDIKPQNILLNADGVVKVADFGIAKAPETATVTISGSNVLGSVHYISPEQARGTLTDEKTDIYSIGIVLYEMVTGTVPFTGDSPVAVALKHLQDAPKPPREIVPEIPKALELVILKAISKEQSCRYDNAREMARDLERSILEPEGAYVKIKQPEEVDGTRPMHPIKAESFVSQVGPNTGQSRRPQPPRAAENPWRRKQRAPAALNALLLVLLAAALLGGAYLGIRALLDTVPTRLKMPDFTNKDVEIVKQQLAKIRLKSTVNEEPSDQVGKNVVISHVPAAGEYVTTGDTVILTVSSGVKQVDVPDVTGKSRQEAIDALKLAGLAAGNVRPETSDQPRDTVLRQEPAGGTLPMGGKVDIWFSRPVEPTVKQMPNLFGKNKDEAVKFLGDMNITVNRIVPKHSSVDAIDIVVGQKPEADAPIDSGTVVEIYISDGEKPGYSKDYPVPFEVAKDDTLVKIVYVDGGMRTTMYDEKRKAGASVVTLTLDTMTAGDKTVIVYFDGAIFRQDIVPIP